MTGKIPKISDECVMAIIEKAGQESPSIFATEFLADLVAAEQKPVATLLLALTEQFCDNDKQSAKLVATVGLIWKQIETTMEAEEMNKAWSQIFQEEKRMVFKTELTIVVEDGVVQDVEGLPSGWTFQVDDNDVSGFEVGIYKKEQEDE